MKKIPWLVVVFFAFSVVTFAQDRLLLIHGVIDKNVDMQNTTHLVYERQKADKQFDLMIYPTQRHDVSDPAQAKHLYALMTEFILKNL